MEWTLVDIGKKHVIPKSQYRRKRREFFHNEDREENLKQHQDKQNIDHTTSKKQISKYIKIQLISTNVLKTVYHRI